MRMKAVVALAPIAALAIADGASAQALAMWNWDGNRVGGRNLSFSQDVVAFSSGGDGFGEFQRGVSSSIPFALLDDTLSVFPPDTLGIVSELKTDRWFGAVDTQNGDNSGDLTATWTFDISSMAAVHLNIKMGAMGDFETTDIFRFDVDIDGGGFSAALNPTVNEAGNRSYTMDSGTVVNLDDPLEIGGVSLSNNLRWFGTGDLGTGSVMTVRLTVNTDGGSEAFVMDNMSLTIPTPGALALFGLGGLVAGRRRRA
jgi:hypothetical protein